MKKISAGIFVLSSIGLFLIAASTGKAEDAQSTVTRMNSELQHSGVVTPQEAAAIEAPLKDMVGKGASQEELKGVITELSNKGVKGDDLKQAVYSMNERVNKGEDPKAAGSLVSQAAAQAHEQGLKGKDLADKVQEAGQEMQAEKRASIETKKEQKERGSVRNKRGRGYSPDGREGGTVRSSSRGQGRGKK